jgi:hypothetical protein
MAGAVPVLSRRHDPTAVALLLASLALLVRTRLRPSIFVTVLSVVLFGLSLGAKETSFGAVLILPFIVFVAPSDKPKTIRTYVTVLAPYVGMAILLFALRYIALGSIGGHRDIDLTPDAGRYRLILDEYVTQLFWPFRSFYPERTVGWAVLVALALPLIVVAIACLPKRERIIAALGAIWVIAFGLFIVVTQHKPGPWYMYYPLPGLALLIGAFAQRASSLLPAFRARSIAPAAVTALSAVYLAGLVVKTPIPWSYGMWSAASNVETTFREGAVACAAETPDGGKMEVNGAPYLLEQHDGDADLLSITWFQEFTVDSAVKLAYPDKHVAIVVWSYISPKSMPQAVDTECFDPPAMRQYKGHYR